MPYFIGFIVAFIVPIFKAIFKAIFSKDMYLFMLRGAIILSLLTLFTAFVVLFLGVLTSVIGIFNTSLSFLTDKLNGGAGGSSPILDCFYYYIHFLGLDVALTSFLSGVFSLFIIYVGFRISAISFILIFKTKHIVFKGLS